jgi:hypothetical protein
VVRWRGGENGEGLRRHGLLMYDGDGSLKTSTGLSVRGDSGAIQGSDGGAGEPRRLAALMAWCGGCGGAGRRGQSRSEWAATVMLLGVRADLGWKEDVN